MKSGIYQITCTKNNKSYVGSSYNVSGRIKEHFRVLRKSQHYNPLLQNAFNKYGEHTFEFKTIQTCPVKDLIKIEQAYIDTGLFKFNINKQAGRPPYTEPKVLPECLIKEIVNLRNINNLSVNAISKKTGVTEARVGKLLNIDKSICKNIVSIPIKDVLKIRWLSKRTPSKNIANFFNFSRVAIENIKNGKTYKEIKGECPCEDLLLKIHKPQVEKRTTAKKVYQYDLEGNYIREFSSARVFCKNNDLQKAAFNNIQSVCKGKQVSAYGFMWRYELMGSISSEKNIKKQKMKFYKRTSAWGKRPRSKVLQYDKQMNLIKTWENLNECYVKGGFSKSGVSNCAKGKNKSYKNFIWKYSKEQII